MAKQKTLLEKITTLLWWNHLPSIKEILLGLYYQGLAGKKFYEAGTNINFTGTGTEEDPILINASGSGGGIASIQAGTNISVNNADPLNPIISATGGGGGSQDLQGVTDLGSTTTNPIIVGDPDSGTLVVITPDSGPASGIGIVDSGRSVNIGAPFGVQLQTRPESDGGVAVNIKSDNVTTPYNAQLPGKTGEQTFAMISDTGNSGKQTINPSLGTITIPHGLGVDPAFISFNFDDTRSLEMRSYLVTTNATNIIITFDSPPLETTAIVWWSAKP